MKIMESTSKLRKALKCFDTVLLLIALFSLTACERIVSGTEKDAVLAFSEPTMDNLFAGWAANDYAVFSRDFDADMQEEIPATGFATWQQDFENKLGTYISCKVDRVARADEFYVVDFQAKFSHEEPVKITVAFHASDHSIASLSFHSEKISWSTFEK